MRRNFVVAAVTISLLTGVISTVYPAILWSMVVMAPLIILGFYDLLQKKHAVLRNFPIIGHFRYMAEAIRPEISQYFIESDTDGLPFNREQRSVVYQRAKKVRDTVPFGTKRDVYEVGYEWVNHSIRPIHLEPSDLRVVVGELNCKQPYSASRLNISAMSFGSLSKNAVLALNQGAKMGNFAHNTGEGGISPYHLQGGGDLIWQIGTGYFGCRNIWTGMIALVRLVTAASITLGFTLNVFGSISTNTGRAPSRDTVPPVAKKVRVGTITSSPGPVPIAINAQRSASVPLLTATACATSKRAHRVSSSCETAGPPMKC